MPDRTPWCPVCGASHPAQEPCPEDLPPSGPERHSWRISVNTSRGAESVGVLVAPVGGRWRARIITYPGEFWTVSRGAAVLKFYADSPGQAERDAVEYVESAVQESGLTRSSGGLPVRFDGDPEPEGIPGRRLCHWDVRFGHNALSRTAVLDNASERGLFIRTDEPLPSGSVVRLELDAAGTRIPLRGTVAWVRHSRETGRPVGMGVRLVRPSAMYLDSVKKLS